MRTIHGLSLSCAIKAAMHRLCAGRRAVTNHAKPGRHSAADAGLTLVELLVVLAILALVAGIAAPQVLRYLGTAKTEAARTQLNHLASAVELYFIDVGAYPPHDVGLRALVDAPPQAPRWNGPYLKKETALTDPWGRPYGYRFPGQRGDAEIFSLGRDGQQGGAGEDADVTSW